MDKYAVDDVQALRQSELEMCEAELVTLEQDVELMKTAAGEQKKSLLEKRRAEIKATIDRDK